MGDTAGFSLFDIDTQTRLTNDPLTSVPHVLTSGQALGKVKTGVLLPQITYRGIRTKDAYGNLFDDMVIAWGYERANYWGFTGCSNDSRYRTAPYVNGFEFVLTMSHLYVRAGETGAIVTAHVTNRSTGQTQPYPTVPRFPLDSDPLEAIPDEEWAQREWRWRLVPSAGGDPPEGWGDACLVEMITSIEGHTYLYTTLVDPGGAGLWRSVVDEGNTIPDPAYGGIQLCWGATPTLEPPGVNWTPNTAGAVVLMYEADS